MILKLTSNLPRPRSCNASRTSARQHAFTLVELLVVVAVISILAGLLIPVLGSALATVDAAQCASNLKQLGLGLNLYANDFNNMYVRASEDIFSISNLRRWHGVRGSTTKPFNPRKGPLVDYLGEDGLVKTCPTLRNTADTGFEAGCGGYGMNAHFVGSRCWTLGMSNAGYRACTKSHEFKRPSKTVAFTDTAYVATIDGREQLLEYSFAELPYWADWTNPSQPGSGQPNPSIHFRHDAQANVLWLDGHVSAREMDFTIASYLTHGGATPSKWDLGWFGPEDFSLFDNQ
ncbi:MAG: prepilin-type N-terminal cleavage/methylation domain-containing protein [Planctomycetes bacterium]|nr:prepilin-type N-terminal cleavage/methylation domain-containing protein [Planctomycetota bacterium]